MQNLSLFAEEERPLIMLLDDEKISYNDYLRELQMPARNIYPTNARQAED